MNSDENTIGENLNHRSTTIGLRWYPVVPVPAPRQVRRDKFKPTDSVLRYRAFRDEISRQGVQLRQFPSTILFVLPMAPSWSRTKRNRHRGMPHEQTPDKDNLEKALLDSIYGDDSHVWYTGSAKVWGDAGAIFIWDSWLVEFMPPLDIPTLIITAENYVGGPHKSDASRT